MIYVAPWLVLVVCHVRASMCKIAERIVRIRIVFSVNAGNVTQNNLWSLTDYDTEKLKLKHVWATFIHS